MEQTGKNQIQSQRYPNPKNTEPTNPYLVQEAIRARKEYDAEHTKLQIIIRACSKRRIQVVVGGK